MPVCPPLAHIPSLHRAKQGGRVYHFELRSNKHRLRLQVCFFGGAVRLSLLSLLSTSCKPFCLVASTLPESKKLAEAGNAAAVLQEVVPAKLFRGCTALHVDAQAHTQERLQLLGQLLGLLKPGRAVRCDQVESLEGLFVQVWWLRLDHFDRHNAEGPDIDLRAILLLLDDFGCHPVWRTDHGSTLRALLGELGAETEISNLDVAA